MTGTPVSRRGRGRGEETRQLALRWRERGCQKCEHGDQMSGVRVWVWVRESEGPIERERGREGGREGGRERTGKEREERDRTRARALRAENSPSTGGWMGVRATRRAKKGGRTGSELEQAAPYTVMRIPTLAVDRYLGPLLMYLPAAGTDLSLTRYRTSMPARADPGSLGSGLWGWKWGGGWGTQWMAARVDERDGFG